MIEDEIMEKYFEEEKSIKYYVGDPKHGNDIIAALEALGGKQRFRGACKGSNPTMVYLIDNGIIGCQMKEYFLRDNPNSKELKLFPDKEIYFRGDANRGSEIIKALEELGGQKNHFLEGCNPNNIYFIDFDNNIKNYNSEHFTSQLIMKYWKEEFLPEELIEIDGKVYDKSLVLKLLKGQEKSTQLNGC